MSVNHALLGLSAVAAVAAIGFGLYQIGSPTDQRAYRLDYTRLLDLHQLAGLIAVKAKEEGALPERIVDLSLYEYPADPETGEPYTYKAEGDRYELCAVFAKSSRQPEYFGSWAHEAGLHCFEFELNSLRGIPPVPRW